MLNESFPVVLKSKTLFEGYITLKEEMLASPSNQTYPYLVVETAPIAVMVLPKTPSHHFVLNWEYRHPTQRALLSCPGGIQMVQETSEACAQRELLEETGYGASHFKKIGESFPLPGLCTQKTVYFLAEGAYIQAPPTPEQGELIKTELFNWEQLKTLIQGPTFLDAHLMTALSFFFLPTI